jgi:hypothetical protein
MQPGCKSHINFTEAEYFNLSEKEVRIATAKRQTRVPTIEQIKHVIVSMPRNTVKIKIKDPGSSKKFAVYLPYWVL